MAQFFLDQVENIMGKIENANPLSNYKYKYLGKGQFAYDTTICNGHLPKLVHPSLTTQYIVHTCGHFIPCIVILVSVTEYTHELILSQTNE